MFTSIEQLYEIYKKHPIICNDNRKISQGCIYWALKGERFDGNNFADSALEAGAAYVVIDNPHVAKDSRYLLVDDTLLALQQLANIHIKTLGIPVIAIAGSNGKTTSKELIARVLGAKYNCFATPGNFNNHIGLPLSVLQMNNDIEVAVLELGANHIGENAALCEICKPTYGLVTNIGKDHLEGFGSMDGVEQANMELFDYLRAHKGIAFVNADDERISRNTNGLEAISYGINNVLNTSVQGCIINRFPLLKVSVTQANDSEETIIHSQLFGAFHVYNIMAAYAIGRAFSVEKEAIAKAIEGYIPANNRSQLIERDSNTYIMDAYNANPSSMEGGVKDFIDYPADSKVLILGDMFELGENSQQEHQAILQLIPPNTFKAILLAGSVFCSVKEYLPEAHYFDSSKDAAQWLANHPFEQTVFYVKGSRGMKMEQVVGVEHH
jgi:UDP-N-acetylmuramoyl-tripeptide--D-alanyl-D-alanine ligase